MLYLSRINPRSNSDFLKDKCLGQKSLLKLRCLIAIYKEIRMGKKRGVGIWVSYLSGCLVQGGLEVSFC